MGLFNRRPKLPSADRPPLATDERVLAWAAAGTGEGGNDGVLVASNRGLWLPGRVDRLGWHDILNSPNWATPAERRSSMSRWARTKRTSSARASSWSSTSMA